MQVFAVSFYLTTSKLFIVKSPLSGIIKMSDIPHDAGFLLDVSNMDVSAVHSSYIELGRCS